MRRRRWVTGAGAALALIAGAGGAGAQDTFSIELLDGGKPVPDARVTVVDDQGARTTVPATTDAAGRIQLPMALLDMGKGPGTRMDVHRRVCRDGRVELVVAPEGTTGACVEEGQQAGEECDCERVGVAIFSGDGWVVDIGVPGAPGAIQPIGMPPPAAATAPPLAIGIGGGLSWFPNLENIVQDQPGLTGSDVPSSAPFIEGVAEYRILPRVVAGVDVTHSFFDDITQTYQGLSDGPSSSEIDYDVTSLGLYGAWRPSPHAGDRLGLFFGLGGEHVWNRATVTTRYPQLSAPVTEDRSESGWQTTARIGLDWHFDARTSLRLGASYSRGESDSADERIGLEGKLMWNVKPYRELRGRDLR